MPEVILLGMTDNTAAHIAACSSTGQIFIRGKSTCLESALESGHLSVLEHIYMSWHIKDVSRACMMQFRTHRIASFTLQSQRYCHVDSPDKCDAFSIPISIENSAWYKRYCLVMNDLFKFYNKMIEDGIPKEDARYCLPESTLVKSAVISLNARAFVEMAQKRLCNKAQWEIRSIFINMYDCLESIYSCKTPSDSVALKYILRFAQPYCQIHGKCPEKKSCGKPMIKG